MPEIPASFNDRRYVLVCWRPGKRQQWNVTHLVSRSDDSITLCGHYVPWDHQYLRMGQVPYRHCYQCEIMKKLADKMEMRLHERRTA